MKFSITFLFIISALFCKAQLSFKELPIKLGYYSNVFINPGLSVGTEYIFKQKSVPPSKKSLQKKLPDLKKKTWLVSGQFGSYIHLYNHTVVFTNYEVRYRKTTKRGRKFYTGFGLGVERSFLPETYEVKTDGTINKIFLPGHFYFSPVLSFGSQLNNKVLGGQNDMFMEIQIPFLVDYNNTLLPKINLAIGVILNKKKHETAN